MAIGDAPKPKLRSIEEIARGNVVADEFITFNQQLFAGMEVKNKTLMATMQPAFDEFVKVWHSMTKENPNTTIFDVQKRIPNNRWLILLMNNKALRSMPKYEYTDADRQAFEDKVIKKIKGKDIN